MLVLGPGSKFPSFLHLPFPGKKKRHTRRLLASSPRPFMLTMWSALLTVPLMATTNSGRSGFGVVWGEASCTRENAISFVVPPMEGEICPCGLNSSPLAWLAAGASLLHASAAHLKATDMIAASD